MTLADMYRPRRLQDVVGLPKTKAAIASLMRRGLGGKALWISGPSGCGKTTLARILASAVADESLNIQETDATRLSSDTLDQWRNLMALSVMTSDPARPCRAFIVNEAHGLRRDIMRTLLVALEDLPDTCLWVFTTTNDGQVSLFEDKQDARPLLSRCLHYDLEDDVRPREMAERAKEIAEAEGLGGAPLSAYILHLSQHQLNMRSLLMAVEAGRFLATAVHA
jgi:DNA polymerase III gamma/tau subunit